MAVQENYEYLAVKCMRSPVFYCFFVVNIDLCLAYIDISILYILFLIQFPTLDWLTVKQTEK